jgi:hypothetical protein
MEPVKLDQKLIARTFLLGFAFGGRLGETPEKNGVSQKRPTIHDGA